MKHIIAVAVVLLACTPAVVVRSRFAGLKEFENLSDVLQLTYLLSPIISLFLATTLLIYGVIRQPRPLWFVAAYVGYAWLLTEFFGPPLQEGGLIFLFHLFFAGGIAALSIIFIFIRRFRR